MEELAHYDKLTSLPNRIALELYLPKAIAKAENDNTTLSFLYLGSGRFQNSQ